MVLETNPFSSTLEVISDFLHNFTSWAAETQIATKGWIRNMNYLWSECTDFVCSYDSGKTKGLWYT